MQYNTKRELQNPKAEYRAFIAGLKSGDRVGVRMPNGNISMSYVSSVVQGPFNLINCHNHIETKKHQGAVVQLDAHGTFSATTGNGLVNDDCFLVPPTPRMEREAARREFGDGTFNDRMRWFSPMGWSDEEIIDFFEIILSKEWERGNHGWFENHFGWRPDRDTTLELLLHGMPDKHDLINERIRPWYEKYLNEMDGAARDVRTREYQITQGNGKAKRAAEPRS